jgi:hypothetical protein
MMELHTRYNDYWVFCEAEAADETRRRRLEAAERVYEATETDLEYLEDNSNGEGI